MLAQTTVKGRIGEFRTKKAHRLFLDSERYHIFNNIFFNIGSRPTQIDHIIVSIYGIFVIETKYKNGWIFGSPDDKQWTLALRNKKIKFQNPLQQNRFHTKIVSKFLRIEHNKIFSVVVFWGNCHLMTDMPENVSYGNYTDYITSKNQLLLSENEVKSICNKLLVHQCNTPFLAGWRYANSFKE